MASLVKRTAVATIVLALSVSPSISLAQTTPCSTAAAKNLGNGT
jgi:hypothetical protein